MTAPDRDPVDDLRDSIHERRRTLARLDLDLAAMWAWLGADDAFPDRQDTVMERCLTAARELTDLAQVFASRKESATHLDEQCGRP